MKNSESRPPRLPLAVLNCLLALLIASSYIVLAQERDSSAEPQILLFRVLPASIEGEQWHEFHWQVMNTDNVELIKDGTEMPGRTQLSDGRIGWPLSMSGSLRMRLKKLTTFELVATNRTGQSERKTFTVKGPFSTPPTKPPAQEPEDSTFPRIHSFRVSPATAEPGGSIKFHWQVENEEMIRLFEGHHEIDLRGMGTRKVGEVGASLDENRRDNDISAGGGRAIPASCQQDLHRSGFGKGRARGHLRRPGSARRQVAPGGQRNTDRADLDLDGRSLRLHGGIGTPSRQCFGKQPWNLSLRRPRGWE